MSSIIITKQDGTVYDLDKLGYKVITFDPPSANYAHNHQQVGNYGTVLTSTQASYLTIPLTFRIKAMDRNHFELKRFELRKIFDSFEWFWVHTAKMPYIRWKVVADPFSLNQQDNSWYSQVITVNLICDEGFAETVADTTIAPTYPSEKWGYSLNMPEKETAKYSFKAGEPIKVWNASNIDLTADEHPVTIMFTGTVTNELSISNVTTGQNISFQRPFTKLDRVVIQGFVPTANGTMIYSQSNHGYLDFVKGWNEIKVYGSDDYSIGFKTKFYY